MCMQRLFPVWAYVIPTSLTRIPASLIETLAFSLIAVRSLTGLLSRPCSQLCQPCHLCVPAVLDGGPQHQRRQILHLLAGAGPGAQHGHLPVQVPLWVPAQGSVLRFYECMGLGMACPECG